MNMNIIFGSNMTITSLCSFPSLPNSSVQSSFLTDNASKRLAFPVWERTTWSCSYLLRKPSNFQDKHKSKTKSKSKTKKRQRLSQRQTTVHTNYGTLCTLHSLQCNCAYFQKVKRQCCLVTCCIGPLTLSWATQKPLKSAVEFQQNRLHSVDQEAIVNGLQSQANEEYM